MRLTHRRLTLLGCLSIVAVALVAASAPSAGVSASKAASACDPGPTKINGKWWVVYCGPAKSTARFAGKTMRFSSGKCRTIEGAGGKPVLAVALGKRAFRGKLAGTKYWELLAAKRGDGVYRKDVFIEWWLGKKKYLLADIKMTFKNKQRQGTYTGTFVLGAKGKASGTFRCSG